MSSVSRFQRAVMPVAAVAALVSVLSACNGEKRAEPRPATTPAAQVVPLATTTTTTTAPAPAAGQLPVLAKTQGWLKIYGGVAPAGTVNPVQLNVVSDPVVGQRVSDGAGRSLYRFDKDTAKPPVSNCAGQCAVTWPPLTVARGQSLFAAGVDPQLVGFIERADGSCQITVAGWPVYYFAKDQKPGDLLGQGVGGTWFAVAPNGGKALAR